MALLADVEGQLKTLREAHEARRRESARLMELRESIERKEREVEQRAGTLRDQQSELDQARSRLAQVERESAHRERDFNAAKQRVAELERDLEAARAKFQQLGDELTGARAELRSAHELAAQRQRDREAREEAWRVESQSLKDQIEVFRQERETLRQEAESLRKDRDGVRGQSESALQELNQKIATLEAELRSREEEIESLRGEAAGAQSEQQELRDAVAELRSRLEQAESSASDELAAIRDERDLARQALEEAEAEGSVRAGEADALRAQVEELTERLERAERQSRETIESLQTQLEQARLKSEGAGGEAEKLVEQERERLQGQIAEYKAKLDDAMAELQTRTQELRTVAQEYKVGRSRLEQAQTEVEGLGRELGEAREQIARQQHQCAMLEEALAQSVAREKGAEARAQEFEQRLDKVRAEGGIDEEVAERIRQLVSERDRAQRDLESMAKDNQRLRAEIQEGPPDAEELRAALEQARTQLRQRADDGPAPVARGDAFNEKRRERLRLGRRLLRERAKRFRVAGNALIRRMEEAEEIVKQRGEVVRATHRLRAIEKRLTQRQAGAKAGIGVICMVLSLAIVGSFAWLTAKSIAPARYAAVVSIEPHVQGRALTDDQKALWRGSTEEILLDPGVIESAAGRMSDRGLEDLSDAGSLLLRLENDLAVLDGDPERITLELRGDGAREVERVLDTYARAVVSAANLNPSAKASGAATQLAGPVEVGDPIESQALYYAAIGLAIGTLLCMLLMLVLYRKLAKVKSDFEQAANLDMVLDDARWISPSKGV